MFEEEYEEEMDLEISRNAGRRAGHWSENYDPTLDLARYQYPTIDLLTDYGVNKVQVTKEELEANKDKIVETLGTITSVSPASKPPSAQLLRSMKLCRMPVCVSPRSRTWKMILP